MRCIPILFALVVVAACAGEVDSIQVTRASPGPTEAFVGVEFSVDFSLEYVNPEMTRDGTFGSPDAG